MGRDIKGIPAAEMETLRSYAYQGNVRELENMIERAVILATDGVLRLDGRLQTKSEDVAPNLSGEKLEDVQRNHILRILEECNWRIEGAEGAAERLGLKASTLRSRMQKLGIKKQ